MGERAPQVVWAAPGYAGAPTGCLEVVATVAPRPEQLPLLALGVGQDVREHLATFLAYAARMYAAPLPRYVVKAFEDYLGCGDLARGFLRCHCDGCGHDVLVAFSCKGRGMCPSCGARRMCNEAAMLVDRVLPNAPIRQWVLSLPFELRGLAATKPDVLGAMERIFAEEIETHQASRQHRRGGDGLDRLPPKIRLELGG
jgi:hypothetical protein